MGKRGVTDVINSIITSVKESPTVKVDQLVLTSLSLKPPPKATNMFSHKLNIAVNDVLSNQSKGEKDGRRVALKNKKGTIVEGSLINFEGGHVLVLGLISLTKEEAGPSDVVEEEKVTKEPLIEPFETQD